MEDKAIRETNPCGKRETKMLKRMLKWSAVVASSSLLAVGAAGCDLSSVTTQLTDLINQILGQVTPA
jgi:hypothetical protein